MEQAYPSPQGISRCFLLVSASKPTVFIPHPDQLCPNSCSASAAESQIFSVTSALRADLEIGIQQYINVREKDGGSFDSTKKMTSGMNLGQQCNEPILRPSAEQYLALFSHSYHMVFICEQSTYMVEMDLLTCGLL